MAEVDKPSRALRFMTEGVLLYFFGEPIKTFLYERFNILSVLFVVLLAGGFWLVSWIGRKRATTVEDEVPAGD